MSTFRISGLDPEPFRDLFGKSDEELAALGARRERALLVHYTQLDGAGLRDWITSAFDDGTVAFIDVHNAKRGCFAARARRA